METEPTSSDSMPEAHTAHKTSGTTSKSQHNGVKLTLKIKPLKKSTDSTTTATTGKATISTSALEIDTKAPVTANHAVWTDADLTCLLEFLLLNKARAGDGGSFIATVFNEAAIECNKIRTQGAKKTGKMVRNKWSSNLCPTWKICRAIDDCSGLGGFDTKTGAHVTPESEPMWEDLLRSNPAVLPYKYTGWVYWDKMKEILGSPPPTGHRVFRPNQAVLARSVSPIWDIENSSNLPTGSQDTDIGGSPASIADDTNSDIEFPTTPKPSTTVWSGKRQAAGPPLSVKKPRLSGSAQAIGGMCKSMDHFTGAMLEIFAAPVPAEVPVAALPQNIATSSSSPSVGTPRHRRQIALAKVEQELDLTVDDQVDLIEMFEKDSTLVDSYLGFTKDALRERWIARKLAAFRSSLF
ncbi:hypothetical protein F5050DRAFT_1891003 [Lentinula boryana]|uniref:Myb/SANT-like domain-containing protein n=1 Tax=Lentinula boryana TaxID=40481 RepID=A0ABQ8QT52_9AGAR|nr:hypothetical protein F5050DRAFT_1891003 [Lentinula boryana]